MNDFTAVERSRKTMFASKTPRDLNHDPEPIIETHSGTRRAKGNTLAPHGTWAPRPEFDHVQHNEPNPILVAFREVGDPENPGPWIDASWSFSLFGGYREWEDDGSYFHAFTKATDAHNRHAREVLTRLPALREVSA